VPPILYPSCVLTLTLRLADTHNLLTSIALLHTLQDGTTPAWIAAKCGHVEALALLRDAGANLNKKATKVCAGETDSKRILKCFEVKKRLCTKVASFCSKAQIPCYNLGSRKVGLDPSTPNFEP